jgi:hypothetical protein
MEGMEEEDWTDEGCATARAQAWQRRRELLLLVRDGVRLGDLERRELERLRDDLILALTLERDRVTRELLPNPLSRDEFARLDRLYGRVMARLAGN